MVKKRRLGLVVLLAAVLAALPVAALAKPPDVACKKEDKAFCLPTTTTTTLPVTTTTITLPVTTTTITLPVTTTTITLPSTTTTTIAATTTTDPDDDDTAATTTTTTTTTTDPDDDDDDDDDDTATTTTTTHAGTTTTTTSAGGATGRPSDPGSPGATVTLPAPAGLHTVDMGDMSSSMAGAVMIVAKSGDTGAEATDMPEAPGGLSVSINRLLGPVAPPALVDAVASPLVVIEALIAAMTSSSQALIIPGVVLLVGFGIPGRRRNGDRRHRALTFEVPSS